MRWPDVTRLAVNYLHQATGVRTVTVLPTELETRLPLHRVTRGPGSDDKITDSPLVDIETFVRRAASNSEAALWEAAEDARQAMHALAGVSVQGALVDSVTTAQAPVYVDYGNPAVLRAVASYRLTLRKR